LILVPAVAGVEVTPALAERHAGLLEVVERGDAVADAGALRQPREVCIGQLPLGLDPGARRRRVELLEPAVRVGDPRAMVVLDHAAARRRRVGGPAAAAQYRGAGPQCAQRERRAQAEEEQFAAIEGHACPGVAWLGAAAGAAGGSDYAVARRRRAPRRIGACRGTSASSPAPPRARRCAIAPCASKGRSTSVRSITPRCRCTRTRWPSTCAASTATTGRAWRS